MTDRASWLASLQPGDEVALWTLEAHRPAKIERITPTRRFVVRQSTRRYEFNSNGEERGVSRFNRYSMEPITDAIREGWERDRLAYRLGRTMWATLPLETLRQVVGILEGEGE